MNKEVRLVALLVAVAVISAACRHKPAYSDIDANKAPRNQNQNSETQAGTEPSTAGQPPAAGDAQPAPAPPPPPRFVSPSFIDQTKGGIKDLPDYPRASRYNVQIGPNQGVNFMSQVLQTTDSLEMIVAFYEGVIKNNGWTVTNKMIDPDLTEWSLKKGEENSAKIQVKKEPQTGRRNIIIVRGEKLVQPGK
ncbi:MAG: hypothetical protein AABO57_21155 [Acidobacteriota bacterium]